MRSLAPSRRVDQSRRLDLHQHRAVYRTAASLFGHVGKYEREESNPVRQGWNLPALPGAHSCMGTARMLPGAPRVRIVLSISSAFVPKEFQFHFRRRVVNRIGVGKGFGPQPHTPRIRKLLCLGFAGKPSSLRARLGIDDLKVPQFVEEYVVQQESPNRSLRPLVSS